MPGIFGVIGGRPETCGALERSFTRRWANTASERFDASIIGGHAHADTKALHHSDNGQVVAVDGEWSLYNDARQHLPHEPESLFRVNANTLVPQTNSVGNLALLEPAVGTLYLAVDATGTFPLYFSEYEGGFYFSSLLKPLAEAMSASRADLAVLEFLRQAYTVGGKTVFQGISRLLPGQSLSYSPGKRAKTAELSQAWNGSDVAVTASEAAEVAWSELERALRRSLPRENSALMMSGGWDSRTLLAGAAAAEREVTCYSHGDTESRELRIVERACRAAGVPLQLEPIDDRVLNLDLLQRGFDRVENVVFPHWHRAGSVLGDAGVSCVAAGVFGEILGGHYGPAMLASTPGKLLSITSLLLGLKSPAFGGTQLSAREFLRVKGLGRHWYLNPDFEASITEPLVRMNADIDGAINRLSERGITDPATVVEAFISEHRGTQYINAQLLSCRASTDLALPFAGGELFSFATRVPLTAKVHNSLNRRMLAKHASPLLRDPMAATLVSANAPILAQEASRLARKIYSRGRSSANSITRGRVPRLRLGWVDFEFLRKSEALHNIVDDLRCAVWDLQAIRSHVSSLEENVNPAKFHPFFDQLGKIYTVDLMCR